MHLFVGFKKNVFLYIDLWFFLLDRKIVIQIMFNLHWCEIDDQWISSSRNSVEKTSHFGKSHSLSRVELNTVEPMTSRTLDE